MNNSCAGVLYVATGEKHFFEALNNASLSREHSTNFPITLVTDCIYCDSALRVFDTVSILYKPSFSYRDKLKGMLSLPYPRTLFLDSDARLLAPVSSLFDASTGSDLAACHAPVRLPAGWRDESVPDLFSEINSGVLLWKRSRTQRNLIREWLSLYDRLKREMGQTWDQSSLRSVLWRYIQRKNFKLSVLPSEANFRTTKPWVAGKGLPVHVLHGRVPEDEEQTLISFLNHDYDRFRTWSDWFELYPKSALKLRIGNKV